jgi:hypothetical protein
MRPKTSHGCSAAIFLTCIFSSTLSLAQGSFSYSSQSFSNHGVLTKGYWGSQEIDLRPTHTIGYSDVNFRASWSVKDQDMFFETFLLGGDNRLCSACIQTESETWTPPPPRPARSSPVHWRVRHPASCGFRTSLQS